MDEVPRGAGFRISPLTENLTVVRIR